MSIIFIYHNDKYRINIKNINTINEAISEFISITKNNKNDLMFLYKGKIIKNKISLNKLNNIIISVFNLRNSKNINNSYIRCPKCQNLSYLNINKNSIYNISLGNCKNNHEYNDLSIDEFIKYQNDIIKLECDICKNKKNLYNNNFYICSCEKLLCKLCLEKHNIKNHKIIKFNKRYDICSKHEKGYISYCKDCKLNLCEKCEEEHYDHKIILDKMIIKNKINIEDMKRDLNENIKRVKEYKEEINILNELYNTIIINYKKYLDDYINLINKILFYLDNLKNYETINNVINFNLEILNKDINNYFMNETLKKRMIYLVNIIDRNINQMEIIYEINKDKNELKIFDSKFIQNNKNCLMIIDNRINEVKENHIINDKRKNLKILLFNYKVNNDMSYMFYKCKQLSSISDISKWNTNTVINMSYMFYGCKKLSSLPDISKWNTNNVINLCCILGGCEKLSSLPDISKWNTNNVTNMSSMFLGCEILSSLPDISKWNTSNVINMSSMFYGCEKLSSLPDISKWNTSNVIDISSMFSRCEKLSLLPDISKWNTGNVTNMNSMFFGVSIYHHYLIF